MYQNAANRQRPTCSASAFSPALPTTPEALVSAHAIDELRAILAPEVANDGRRVSRVRFDAGIRAGAAHPAKVHMLRVADGQQGRQQDQEEPHAWKQLPPS